MHLWQIRQFPNERQNSPDWHPQHMAPKLLILSIVAFWQFALIGAAAEDGPSGELSAQQFFDKALTTLNSHRSIQALLVEQVSISDQPIRLTGRYISQGNQLRLELSVKLSGGAEGSLLEVSDGDNLWNQTVIADTKQVTLRNLKQIAAAVGSQPSSPPGAVELGMGGMTGLMSSLQRTMDFEQRRDDNRGETPFVIVQGKWKPEFTEKWQKSPDQPLPSYVPDVLRIYFHAETLFPHRFLYLKRNPEKQKYQPLVQLEFQDLTLDADVDPAEFEFSPPEDLVPEDVTQQYIEQWTKLNATPKNDETPAAEPTSPPPAK